MKGLVVARKRSIRDEFMIIKRSGEKNHKIGIMVVAILVAYLKGISGEMIKRQGQ